MKTRFVAAVTAVVTLFACPQLPDVDGGTGGGSATGGGAATGGGGAGSTGGGGGPAGGGGGGGTGGGTSAFDAGHLDCTFEAPFVLGDGVDNARTQVAVTESGEAVYAWNDAAGIRYVVQSPGGMVGAPETEANATLFSQRSLAAAGNHALVAYGSSVPQLRARRYTTGSGWAAVETLPPAPPALGFVGAAIEPSGAASIWWQEVWGQSAGTELTSDGSSAFSDALLTIDAGYVFDMKRVNGTRLAWTVRSISDVPELVISSSAGTERVPLTGALVAGTESPHTALASDGTAVVTGYFSLSTTGIGAMVRSGRGSFGGAQLLAQVDAGAGLAHRAIGALAGPGGRAAVVWWDGATVFISRFVNGAWAAPESLATTDLFVPRMTSIEEGARGLIHYSTPAGLPFHLEVGADGAVGQPSPSVIDGQVSGAEYAATGARAAAILVQQALDGGWRIVGAQCR